MYFSEKHTHARDVEMREEKLMEKLYFLLQCLRARAYISTVNIAMLCEIEDENKYNY